MVAISPRPSVAAAASVVLFASAWNTADCSMMILVYAPSASSGVSSSFFTAVRSPVMPLTEPIILVIAADSCGLVLDWVPDELMAMSSVERAGFGRHDGGLVHAQAGGVRVRQVDDRGPPLVLQQADEPGHRHVMWP